MNEHDREHLETSMEQLTEIIAMYHKQLVISILEIASCVVAGFIIRFTNPELTETQLFIQFFWWWVFSAAITIKAGCVLWITSK